MNKVFGETDHGVFHSLVGYEVGDVQEVDDAMIIRFDKRVENIIISKEVMFNNDGIYITDDYLLDVLKEEYKK